ncbi:MAG: biotin synthase BioB [Pseudomonadota bacterium]
MTNSAFDLAFQGNLRHNWQLNEIQSLFALPFNDLLFAAQTIHRRHFNPNQVQTSRLLSIKTGACPEDCAYCPQSGHFNTELEKEKLLAIQEVITEAKEAKESGATRFCMGAAWRSPRAKDLDVVIEMVKAVKALGMETCVTLGMLSSDQATALKEAGLDYYNHNIDTSRDYYQQIISTRTFDDRLDTLENVRAAGINVCCGGIIGMGEEEVDRLHFLMELANLPEHPQSVPINRLVAVPGTPLADTQPLDDIEFVRTIAVARIMMPQSYVRLSAGRETMSSTTQALAFFAGANSIFYGDKLLTTPNPEENTDHQLFASLGIQPEMRLESEVKTAPLPQQQEEKPLYYPA